MISPSVLEWVDDTTRTLNAEDVYLCKSYENLRFLVSLAQKTCLVCTPPYVLRPYCEECSNTRSWRSISIASNSRFTRYPDQTCSVIHFTFSISLGKESMNPPFFGDEADFPWIPKPSGNHGKPYPVQLKPPLPRVKPMGDHCVIHGSGWTPWDL